MTNSKAPNDVLETRGGLIIGLMGNARVGKDTFADYVVEQHGYIKVGLADPMKRFCKEVFAFSDAQLYGDERDLPDKRYPRRPIDENTIPSDYLTPRHALQQLGTEWGRDCYQDVWLDYGIRVAKELVACKTKGYHRSVGLLYNTEHARSFNVVFSDLRFKNEFDAMKKAGAVMIRIKRHGYDGDVGTKNHLSEMEQRSIPDEAFDYVMTNNGEILEKYYQDINYLMQVIHSER